MPLSREVVVEHCVHYINLTQSSVNSRAHYHVHFQNQFKSKSEVFTVYAIMPLRCMMEWGYPQTMRLLYPFIPILNFIKNLFLFVSKLKYSDDQSLPPHFAFVLCTLEKKIRRHYRISLHFIYIQGVPGGM